MNEIRERLVREALFNHLNNLVEASVDGLLNWTQTDTFLFNREKFTIRQTRGRGINKPGNLDGALSITTAFTPFGQDPPYNDFVGADGFHRYKYEGTNPDLFTNKSLRLCMEFRLPLVYFVGVRHATYIPIFPTYIIGDDQVNSEFLIGFSSSQIGIDLSKLSFLEKKYILQESKKRVHQPIFRERVINAYLGECAVCHLKHVELLDAAHIISDSKPHGEPIVPNGIALCKIHHAAYDKNFMGIDKNYKIVISEKILYEVDGPMLKHGLQDMHGNMITIPSSLADRPDADRLEERFDEFRQAASA